MAHIRIRRLTAGDGEEDRAEHREPDSRRGLSQVSHGMMRADRGEDFRSAHDSKQAEDADGDEPQQHHRTKDVGNERRAFALH